MDIFFVYIHLHRSSPCSPLSKEVKRPKSDVVHVGNVDSDPPPRSLGPSTTPTSRSGPWDRDSSGAVDTLSQNDWENLCLYVNVYYMYIYIYSKRYIYIRCNNLTHIYIYYNISIFFHIAGKEKTLMPWTFPFASETLESKSNVSCREMMGNAAEDGTILIIVGKQ